MKCDELLPSYLSYAMGKIEEPELVEIRAHLARGCEDCAAGVRAARAFAYSIGATLEGQEPSPQLRERVLAIPDADPKPRLVRSDREVRDAARVVRPRPRFWFTPMPAWLGPAMAAACVVLALTPGFVWRRELAREQSSAAQLREQVAKLERQRPDPIAAARPPQALPIFSLEVVRGAGTTPEAQKLTIPQNTASVVLALPVDLVQQASTAELRNASDQIMWSASPLVAGGSDSVGLTIPGELLAAGRYSVLLRAGERTIARVPFVVYRQSP